MNNFEKLKWMNGTWIQEYDETYMEEYWSEPTDGNMTGYFKMLKKGEVKFLEFMIIEEKANEVFMKIKHFDGEFIGWEDKDKYIHFKLIEVNIDHVIWEELTDINVQLEYKLEEKLSVWLIKNGDVKSSFSFTKK